MITLRRVRRNYPWLKKGPGVRGAPKVMEAFSGREAFCADGNGRLMKMPRFR
ncbi:MAG TPA: hypothetical protein VII75_11285 [Thermoanaerobaculia bacterium]